MWKVATWIALAVALAQSGMASAKIKEVADAGIYCGSFDDEISQFYKIASTECGGKPICVVRATMATSASNLKRHNCTGYFVAPICDGSEEPVNIETHDIFAALTVDCKKK
jgi:hypothetical protein